MVVGSMGIGTSSFSGVFREAEQSLKKTRCPVAMLTLSQWLPGLLVSARESSLLTPNIVCRIRLEPVAYPMDHSHGLWH